MSRILRHPLTAGRVIEGTATIITADNNRLHELNETATIIWELAEHGCTAKDVIARLVSEYEVSEEVAARDVATCVEDMVARKILTQASE